MDGYFVQDGDGESRGVGVSCMFYDISLFMTKSYDAGNDEEIAVVDEELAIIIGSRDSTQRLKIVKYRIKPEKCILKRTIDLLAFRRSSSMGCLALKWVSCLFEFIILRKDM